MNFNEFKSTLQQQAHPPKGLNRLLEALWYEAKGDWNKAHLLAQEVHTRDGAWVHGYLHLREGDSSNASYWYHQANQSMPATSLEEEWARIAKELLQPTAV